MREKELRYVGRTVPAESAWAKVSGRAKYCSDLATVGMLHMKLLDSTIAHGYITDIDTTGAMLPGVRAIYTYKNTPDRYYDRGRVQGVEKVPYQEKLFDRHIRFWGDRIAAVVAETPQIAEQALRKILVSYQQLPAAISVEQAVAPDAPVIQESGNVQTVHGQNVGDYDRVKDAIVTQTTAHLDRMTHATMENQATLVQYRAEDDSLLIHSACQTVFGIRSTVADFLQKPYSKVHVVKALMGGSFGCRQETLLEPLAAFAAQQLHADVRLMYSREEQIVNTMMKHDMDFQVESKISKNGFIRGVRVHIDMNSGAYQTISPSYLQTIGDKLGKCYRIENIRFTGRAVCTNSPVNGSFRSWGTSEAAVALETNFNIFCARMHMDPVDFRLQNVHRPFDRDPVKKITVGNANFPKCLEIGRERFSWDKRKVDCHLKSGRRYRYGVGVALSSHTSSFYPALSDGTGVIVRLQEDGTVIVNTCIHDHGAGTVLAMQKIAAEIFEIDLKRIHVEEADSQMNLYDYGCYGSRSVYVIGNAVKQACETVLHKACKFAASYLHCPERWVRYQKGSFYQETDSDQCVHLSELSYYAINTFGDDIFAAKTYHSDGNPGVPAVHFVEVCVDTFSGFVTIEKYVAVHDVGRAINPDLCIAQIGSGIQQGIGVALTELIKVDPKSGQTLVTNFKNYDIATIADMPSYDALLVEDHEEGGPFGAKSIGEVVIAPVAPAIIAAVNDALDTELTHMPLTPSKILDALDKKNDS